MASRICRASSGVIRLPSCFNSRRVALGGSDAHRGSVTLCFSSVFIVVLLCGTCRVHGPKRFSLSRRTERVRRSRAAAGSVRASAAQAGWSCATPLSSRDRRRVARRRPQRAGHALPAARPHGTHERQVGSAITSRSRTAHARVRRGPRALRRVRTGRAEVASAARPDLRVAVPRPANKLMPGPSWSAIWSRSFITMPMRREKTGCRGGPGVRRTHPAPPRGADSAPTRSLACSNSAHQVRESYCVHL